MLLSFIGRQGNQVQIQSEAHECAHNAYGVANEDSTASVPVVFVTQSRVFASAG